MALAVDVMPPVLLTRRRLTTLVACTLVALGSGTNYVYSAYAPQLGARLHINHTQLNIIGLAGNIGVYATAPIWGRVADRRGPKPLLLVGFVFLLAGYFGIRAVYKAGLPLDAAGEETALPASRMYALVACSFMTGIGGNGGLAGALNAAAKSFPDRTRSSATGLVLSGFGLSAFFFSTLAHALFPGDTGALLATLALGTAAPMALGLLLVVPAPPGPELDYETPRARGFAPRPSPVRAPNSATRLLAGDPDDDGESDIVPRASLELGAPRSRSRSLAHETHPAGELADVPSHNLWRYGDFWLMFAIMSLLSGTGLMYINNVGSISQALFSAGNPLFDPARAAQWQATQVSTVSVANCLGRIFIGLTADLAHNRLGARRAYCLVLVAGLFLASQLSLLSARRVDTLWTTSALLGLAYGALFGLCPSISCEWFGLAHFSENWGFISLSPLLGGNAFSLAFGRDIDAHAAPAAPSAPAPAPSALLVRAAGALARRGGAASDAQCLAGAACYAGSVRMTIGACALALALSVWAGVRDRRKAALVEKEREVLWDAEE